MAAKTFSQIKKILTWGFISILLGVLIILSVSYYEVVQHPDSPLKLVVVEFLKHVGVALLVLGLVGIILDFRDWREYFQEQLAEIVTRRVYLETLDKGELVTLQTDTLKAFFKAQDIDRQGSFLEYFHSRIRDFIASPYREDLKNFLVISPESEDRWLVRDSVSYTCRKVGDYIQPSVSWTLDNDTGGELRNIELSLTVPKMIFDSPSFKTNYPEFEQVSVYGKEDLNFDQGFEFDLKAFKSIDQLKVNIEAEYICKKEVFLSWYINVPTKGLLVHITHPEEVEVVIHFFGIPYGELNETVWPGSLTVSHESWILPNSGFAYQLQQR
jgi:hypothetical protein